MIRVSEDITLANRVIEERFVRASGPGGQNRNQDATAVELRFDIGASSLPTDVKDRLIAMAGRHVTSKGVLVVVGRASGSQVQNREAAHTRLAALIQRAATAPKARRPTLPVRATRLASKRQRSAIKEARRRPGALATYQCELC